jgi:hypothetical protein
MPQIKLIEASVKMPMRKLLQNLWEGTTILSMIMIKSGWAHARNITASIIWFAITTGATAGLSYYKENQG